MGNEAQDAIAQRADIVIHDVKKQALQIGNIARLVKCQDLAMPGPRQSFDLRTNPSITRQQAVGRSPMDAIGSPLAICLTAIGRLLIARSSSSSISVLTRNLFKKESVISALAIFLSPAPPNAISEKRFRDLAAPSQGSQLAPGAASGRVGNHVGNDGTLAAGSGLARKDYGDGGGSDTREGGTTIGGVQVHPGGGNPSQSHLKAAAAMGD